jgi:hypothetical protein
MWAAVEWLYIALGVVAVLVIFNILIVLFLTITSRDHDPH